MLFPSVAILLINAVVIWYVLRSQDRTNSGFFLVLNAISLILWGGGRLLDSILDAPAQATALMTFGALLVPANLLYYAGTRPKPLRPSWAGDSILYLVFLPPLVITPIIDYERLPRVGLGYRFPVSGDNYDLFGLQLVGLYVAGYLIATIVILGARYLSTPEGPDRNLPKHLIAVIMAPVLFTAAFWLATRVGTSGVVPAPALLAALVAQLGLLAVMRQEGFERPLFLSRWIYYVTAALVGFLASHMVIQTYELVYGTPVMDATIRWLLPSMMVAFLAAATLPRPRAWFHRLLFQSAVEYRQLVHETQRELRETHERLRRAERLSVVGELAARIAHEIKNPLGPIKGYTQMMREKIQRDPNFPQRESFLSHLEVIAEEVEAIDSRVRQLLDLARRPLPVRLPLDLNALVERTGTLLRLEVAAMSPSGDTDLQVVVRLAPKLPTLSGDRQRLEEALFNLGRNALEACGTAGRVELRTGLESDETRGETVVVTVQDTGKGLSPEALNSLFTPFFTEKVGGTGLGLPIARTIVRDHGGEIEFENAAGGGAIARVRLPVDRRSSGLVALPSMEGELSLKTPTPRTSRSLLVDAGAPGEKSP